MNTQVNWYAGTTLSAVSESGFVALEGPNDLLLDLWRELEDGANLQRLLQVLAGYYNNNVFHLPDFVAGVFSDGAVHLALRGSITAEVTQVNGFVRTVSALNPIAWEEVRLDDVAALVIQAHGAGTEALPLRSGVTRASMLHWQLREVNRLVGAVKSQAYSGYSSNSAASGVSAASAPATRSAQSVASAYSGYSAGSAASVYSPASVVPSAAEASAARSLLEDTPISEVSSQPVAGLLPSVPSPEADAAETSAATPVSALSEPSPQLPSAPSPAAPSVELLSAPSPQLPAVPAPNPVAASASLAAELVPVQNLDLSIATASPAAPSPASFSPAAPSPVVQTPATEHFEAISSAPSPAPSGAHAAPVAADLPSPASSATSAASAAANAPTSLLDVPADAVPVPAPAAPSAEISEAAPSPEPVSAPAQPKVSRAAAALAAMLGGSSAAKNQAPAPAAYSAPVAPAASYRMDDAPATVPTEIVPAAPAVPSAPLAPGANFQEPAAYSAPAVPSAPLAAPSAPVVAPSAPLAAPSAPASSGELVIADARAARATAAPAAPQNQQNPEDQYFGHLYGQTIGVDVENAAVRELRDDEASGLEFNFEQGEGLDFSRRKGEKAEPTGPIQGINEGNPFSSSPFGGDPATAGSDPVPNPRTQSAELPLEAQATQINPVGNAVPLPGVQAPTGALDVAPGTPWTHDGYTIAVPTGGVQAPPPPVADSANADSDGPEVLAINCVNGHPNPVHASSCRICGGALNGKIVHVKRPSLGTLVASTGGSVTLDADVIVGRLPKAAPGTAVHLMAVASPTKSISKSHCRINIDDWELNLEDLNSTNGTYLLREGQLPRRLGGGQRELLRYGDRIDLGDGVVLSVEP
ncbi:FHA domain protein [Actinomyces graevenitzii F0530]|uniref:FHA domain protein n=1 Tax=Actinomyces graevenitzii F0530 TaxID=1321817 RepID=U1R9G8_9ACTO|nr:FHA domain-containing protein [Actinomyces graevenitzii]ERH16318.1 FHA domain protein [Actinomyces graevenitzii F0530]